MSGPFSIVEAPREVPMLVIAMFSKAQRCCLQLWSNLVYFRLFDPYIQWWKKVSSRTSRLGLWKAFSWPKMRTCWVVDWAWNVTIHAKFQHLACQTIEAVRTTNSLEVKTLQRWYSVWVRFWSKGQRTWPSRPGNFTGSWGSARWTPHMLALLRTSQRSCWPACLVRSNWV